MFYAAGGQTANKVFVKREDGVLVKYIGFQDEDGIDVPPSSFWIKPDDGPTERSNEAEFYGAHGDIDWYNRLRARYKK